MSANRMIRGGLALALLATLVAAFFAPAPASDDGVVLASRVESPKRKPAAISATERSSMEPAASSRGSEVVLTIRPRRAESPQLELNLFSPEKRPVAKNEVSAPPKPSPVAAEAPPQAPPLPFRVLGRYVEDGVVTVFLSHNEKNLAVHAGDTIGQNYRVESVQSGIMNLTYIPLNLKQTLDVGGGETSER